MDSARRSANKLLRKIAYTSKICGYIWYSGLVATREADRRYAPQVWIWRKADRDQKKELRVGKE